MAQAPGTNSLRAVRTFADDIRRVQGAAEAVDTAALTTATSVVAPTVNVRSVGPVPEALSEGFAKDLAKSIPRQAAPAEPRATIPGVKSALQDDLMDIRNVAGGTEEATIVSERTKRKWSFTGAVKESMSSWWKDTLADIKEDAAAAKTLPSQVAPSEKRARIVRAASMDGKGAPKEDASAFMKVSQTTPGTPVAPTTTPAAESAGWTHVDTAPTPATPAAPEPMPKLARPVIRPLSLDIAPARPATPPNLRPYSSAPVDTPSTGRERAWAETALDAESSLAPQMGIDETLRAREQAIQTESAKFAARAREAAQRRKDYEASQQPHSGSRYFVYGTLGIIGLSLVVLAGVGGYAFFMREGPVVDAPEPGIRMLFSVSESVGIPLISDRNDFMLDATERVTAAEGAYGSFVRYYFYYQSDRSQAELPAQAFLDILDLRAPGSFLRTIEPQMMFGAYVSAPNAPFIVFKVRNFEDALGGMLLFEPNLNSDFAPLMGNSLSRDGQVGTFRDEVIGGVDARSLYDDYGNRVMMYSFIDTETLVITTSPAALVALSQVLK